MTSPTQLSLRQLRKEGWECRVVEHWNPFARRRQDLFGFMDIIGFRHNQVMGIQTTTSANIAARVKKIRGSGIAKRWIDSGVNEAGYPTRTIEVHGWRKIGERGKRKLWSCRIAQMDLAEFE